MKQKRLTPGELAMTRQALAYRPGQVDLTGDAPTPSTFWHSDAAEVALANRCTFAGETAGCSGGERS